ncbi:peptidoglycan recognition protein [Streptomyces sp. NPDC088387]|uniref:peptidoglycan recognition protein family protein n=1 Tax=Streptomyces sp. NPDC088387 TaxID=3365859 RepID=UPI003805F132
MRGFLASAIGVTCTAALALPLTLPAAPAAARQESSATASSDGSDTTGVPGSTQSLALAPLSGDRSLGSALEGLARRDVQHFSLLGVVWDDPDVTLHGRVQVRTRAVDTGIWSGWQDLETHNDAHSADPDTAERSSGRVRGATAPLWVGESDGVEVRVQAQAEETASRGADTSAILPAGLRIELIDPGVTGESPVTGTTAEPLEFPALTQAETERELSAGGSGVVTAGAPQAKPYIGPRPKITTRKGWGADESLREKGFVYTKKVAAAFVHHTATGNNYQCADAPSVIRGIYRYHVKSMGWRDIGYNFLVDKCGNIYEGRAGGVAKPVLGAHTLGFNTNSMGIAAIGTFNSTKPSGVAVTAVARLSAWKLGIWGANPKAKTYLKSGGGNLYTKGKNVQLNVISGHRDGFATDCPGAKLYDKLGTIRADAARFQGR